MDYQRNNWCIYLLLVLVVNVAIGSPLNEYNEETVKDSNKQTETAEKVTQINEEKVQPKIEVVKMALSADDMKEIMALEQQISESVKNGDANKKVMAMSRSDNAPGERAARSMKVESGNALSDEEISQIVRMIAFPSNDDDDDKKEATPSNGAMTETPILVEVEPRTTIDEDAKRIARAFGKHQDLDIDSRGYYILAFSPDNDEVLGVPQYTKFDIIPAENTRNLAMAEDDEENSQGGDKEAVEAEESSRAVPIAIVDDGLVTESRASTMNALQKYIRRLMRQIRKGTRKIERQTRYKGKKKSIKEDLTVENVLKHMYQAHQQQKKAEQGNWFKWRLN